MEATTGTEFHDRLRRWARGSRSDEAGVELLIRAYGGRFARQTQPWMRVSEDDTYVDVDWTAIPDYSGGLSSGERRYLLMAASIAGGTEVNIESTFPNLDSQDQDLVVAYRALVPSCAWSGCQRRTGRRTGQRHRRRFRAGVVAEVKVLPVPGIQRRP